MITGHGGNIHEMAARFRVCSPSEIIDMSSNVNPLGAASGTYRLSETAHCPSIEVLPEADACEPLSWHLHRTICHGS
jgi:threonine-phosphate decarboxylase